MDRWFTWESLQGGFAIGAVLMAITSLIFIWRLRGIINWQLSLRNEMKDISNEIDTAGETRKQALQIVLDHCQRSWRATFPELRELAGLSSYLRSIAFCYHPRAEKPELKITIGRFLSCSRELVRRLELILHRSGFKKLKRVRIRHIRKSFEWYDQVNKYRVVKFYGRYQKIIKKLFQLRLVIFPDPFLWVAHLSNRLTILVLTRCLLVDVYLFLGKLAIHAYDEKEKEVSVSIEADELEKTLEDLNFLIPSEPDIKDPQIKEIRNRLVGFTSMVISTPKLEDWKQSVRETANVIAIKYFPDSECPLEEAALGPVLTRSQAWIKSICEAEKIPVVKRFYKIKIESLYNVKSLSDGLLPNQVRTYAKKAWDTYRWTKWPLKVYRMAKKGTPFGIAINVGWVVAKKSFVNFICRHSFDIAHKELEIIYSQSQVKPTIK
jgi:hypothetical protein